MAKHDPTISSEKSTAGAAGDPPVSEALPVNEASHATINKSYSDHPDVYEDQIVQIEDGTDPPKNW